MGKAEVVYIDTEKIAAPIYKLTAALRGGTNTGWTIQMAMAYPSYLAFEWAAWKRFHRDFAKWALRCRSPHYPDVANVAQSNGQMEPSSILARTD